MMYDSANPASFHCTHMSVNYIIDMRPTIRSLTRHRD